jgi:beta-glucosidase
MGLFEHPYATTAWADSLGSSEHRAIAREAVRKSLVLLKNNDNMLPLSKTNGRILVAGARANDIGSQCGGWTITWQGGTGAITPGTTIFNAVRNVRGAENVVYSAGGSTTESVDYAIVVVGETPYAEGSGDTQKPQLTAADLAVISNVEQLGIPYVILLLSGRPLILENVINDATAFVACWLPGTEGSGITDVLFGDFDFTGKLSHSWPSSISQEPLNWGDAVYLPLFPYGYGLSYAQNEVPETDTVAFSVFPNPADDFLQLRTDYTGKVEIVNSLGKTMYRDETGKSNLTIDVKDFGTGFYVISITSKSGTIRQKFVKI